MATEQGTVIKIDAGATWVKTVRSSACKGCTARGSCQTVDGSSDMEVEVLNAAGAKVGDRIVLTFETASLMKATFLLYVFPILVLILGAGIGHWFALNLSLEPSVVSVVSGLSFFVISFMIVKTKANRMAKQDRYKPNITKILP